MAEHDQRLKTLVRECLPELLSLRLPAWLSRFDLSAIRWLEQEIFVDPPHGERRELDLVAQVDLLQPIGSANQTLIHIEIESGDSVADLRIRMPRYHDYLGYKHGKPVLSLALYLGVALQGNGFDETGETYWEETLGRTRWPYLGLPGLDARKYVEGDNLLGVALSVMMRIPEADSAWLKARAMQRIATAELTVHKKYLLMECIEAYLPLHGPHLDQFRRLLLTEDFKEANMLAKTSFELGMEKGRDEGQRALLRELLESRFGTLSETVLERLEGMSAPQLRQLGRDFYRAASLADLGLADVKPVP